MDNCEPNMNRLGAWQTQTAEEVKTLLLESNAVLALALFGSALKSDGQFDLWSDLDCLLVVTDEAFSHYFPATEWLDDLGTLFACEQSENMFHSTTRACYLDFRRLDFVITTPSKLEQLNKWPRIPFCLGVRLLFSRSDQILHILCQTWPTPKLMQPSPAEFDELVNRFWFKSMVASYKVVRNDQLIALHLTLDLIRDCCVLGMMLRDRAEGTNVHRDGGIGNDIVEKLQRDGSDYSATGILSIIEHTAFQFDQLAMQWSDTYLEKRHPLLEWIEQIKHGIDDIQ
jgi:predicted nucleotidyltransferase